MDNNVSKLILGSANFGQNYGINNIHGRISNAELIKILDTASKYGVTLIDTAQTYGDSELRIGQFNSSRFCLITKIFLAKNRDESERKILEMVRISLENLHIKKLEGVLIHNPEILYNNKILNILTTLKEKNIINKVGISIYSPDILNKLVKNFMPDIVQVPFNLFDNRIITTGWAEWLNARGVEIHGRSTFLQGLLLMDEHKVPQKFMERWPHIFNKWFQLQKDLSRSPLSLALNYSLQQSLLNKIVVGVDSHRHLLQIFNIASKQENWHYQGFGKIDEMLLNPFEWSKI